MCGTVAVKLSNPDDDARDMLLNEAKIYNAFPHDLQGSDVPVVPKFYGFYTPYLMSGSIFASILLLEACGKVIRTRSLSHSGRWDNYHNISIHDGWKGLT